MSSPDDALSVIHVVVPVAAGQVAADQIMDMVADAAMAAYPNRKDWDVFVWSHGGECEDNPHHGFH